MTERYERIFEELQRSEEAGDGVQAADFLTILGMVMFMLQMMRARGSSSEVASETDEAAVALFTGLAEAQQKAVDAIPRMLGDQERVEAALKQLDDDRLELLMQYARHRHFDWCLRRSVVPSDTWFQTQNLDRRAQNATKKEWGNAATLRARAGEANFINLLSELWSTADRLIGTEHAEVAAGVATE